MATVSMADGTHLPNNFGQVITYYYQFILNRNPSPKEYNLWVARFWACEGGGLYAWVQQDLSSGPESKALINNLLTKQINRNLSNIGYGSELYADNIEYYLSQNGPASLPRYIAYSPEAIAIYRAISQNVIGSPNLSQQQVDYYAGIDITSGLAPLPFAVGNGFESRAALTNYYSAVTGGKTPSAADLNNYVNIAVGIGYQAAQQAMYNSAAAALYRATYYCSADVPIVAGIIWGRTPYPNEMTIFIQKCISDFLGGTDGVANSNNTLAYSFQSVSNIRALFELAFDRDPTAVELTSSANSVAANGIAGFTILLSQSDLARAVLNEAFFSVTGRLPVVQEANYYTGLMVAPGVGINGVTSYVAQSLGGIVSQLVAQSKLNRPFRR